MRRLLVTGGAGFIGCNFVHYWLGKWPGDRLVVLDALTYAGNLSNLQPVLHHPGLRFVHGNICDTALVERLLQDEQLDTIVHFAAESHVDRSILGPDAFVETNIIGTHSLLKAARKIWLEECQLKNHRFHHISTDEVYGSLGPNDAAFCEETRYAPNSPYSASKAASDHLVRAYHHTYGLDATISNCSNNYGPYHFPEKLIPLIILNLVAGKPLPVYGDGLNVRDWLHVSDHCRAIELVLTNGKAGEVYNIGSGSEAQNISLVRSLCQIADEAFASEAGLKGRFPHAPAAVGKPSVSLVTYVADRLGHDRRYAIDSGKIARELGYLPAIPLESGLRDTFGWYVENELWWRGATDGSYQQWLATQYPSVSR